MTRVPAATGRRRLMRMDAMPFRVALLAILISGLVLNAQSVTYEAVSIRPNRSGEVRLAGFSLSPDGGFTMTNGTVALLLAQSFPQSTRDMIGLPAWASS